MPETVIDLHVRAGPDCRLYRRLSRRGKLLQQCLNSVCQESVDSALRAQAPCVKFLPAFLDFRERECGAGGSFYSRVSSWSMPPWPSPKQYLLLPSLKSIPESLPLTPMSQSLSVLSMANRNFSTMPTSLSTPPAL